MNKKFSKGEWSLQGFPIGERDGKMAFANLEIVATSQDERYLNFNIAKVSFSPEHPGFMPCDLEEAEANARLFAASKKMLEALREILLDMEIAQKNMRDAAKKDPRWDGCAEAIQPRVDAARAAIAAATGEQQ